MTKRVELTIILWGLLIANNWVLAGQQIENWVKVSGLCLSLVIITLWISAQLEQYQSKARNILIVGISLVVGWVLLLPLGAMGLTSYVINLIVLPQWLLRLMYLHRIVIVPMIVICYGGLLLLDWWPIRGRILVSLHAKDDNYLVTIQFGRVISRLVLTSVGGLLLMYLCSTWLARITDLLAGYLLLLLGTLLLANWISTLTMIYFKLPIALKTNFWSNAGLTLIGACLVLGWIGKLNYINTTSTPVVISHRGVDGNNGVQNTMQSLSRTVTKHPAIIEMDVQATQDNSFVCFHDANLKHLARQRTTVAQSKFKDLRDTKLREAGSTTQMTTFKRYLQFSVRHQQSLIVEIKPQSINPVKVAHMFELKYANQLVQQKTRIHSVDDTIIGRLHHDYPKLSVGLIRPFVISRLTNRDVNFYSLDYHTINQQTVNWLHQNNQKVYVWTVNDPVVAGRMAQLGVDGIITNRLSYMRDKIVSHTPVVTRVQNILWQLI